MWELLRKYSVRELVRLIPPLEKSFAERLQSPPESEETPQLDSNLDSAKTNLSQSDRNSQNLQNLE